jgi:hypothetical protein
MFFFSCVTTRGFASCDVHGIGVSYGVFHDVFHGNVCLLLKVSFVHCNGCGVIQVLLQHYLGVFVVVQILHNII